MISVYLLLDYFGGVIRKILIMNIFVIAAL